MRRVVWSGGFWSLVFSLLVLLGLTGCPFNSHGGGGEGGEKGKTCNLDGDCDDSNLCTLDTCVDSFCKNTPVEDGALKGGQKAGDCQVLVCDNGKRVDVNDDSDAPDDGNGCTKDLCKDGEASHTIMAEGSACTVFGNGGACDSHGDCRVACDVATDCVVTPANPCVIVSCNQMHYCEFTPVVDGTPTPGVTQPPGDCKQSICFGGEPKPASDPSDAPFNVLGDCRVLSCDADGNVVSAEDSNDKPVDDGNVCTTEVCNAGQPQHTPVADGTSCLGNEAICEQGLCKPCAPGTANCDASNAVCEPLNTDQNCGTCGHVCTGGKTCEDVGGGSYACALTCAGEVLPNSGDFVCWDRVNPNAGGALAISGDICPPSTSCISSVPPFSGVPFSGCSVNGASAVCHTGVRPDGTVYRLLLRVNGVNTCNQTVPVSCSGLAGDTITMIHDGSVVGVCVPGQSGCLYELTTFGQGGVAFTVN